MDEMKEVYMRIVVWIAGVYASILFGLIAYRMSTPAAPFHATNKIAVDSPTPVLSNSFGPDNQLTGAALVVDRIIDSRLELQQYNQVRTEIMRISDFDERDRVISKFLNSLDSIDKPNPSMIPNDDKLFSDDQGRLKFDLFTELIPEISDPVRRGGFRARHALRRKIFEYSFEKDEEPTTESLFSASIKDAAEAQHKPWISWQDIQNWFAKVLSLTTIFVGLVITGIVSGFTKKFGENITPGNKTETRELESTQQSSDPSLKPPSARSKE